MGQHSDHDRLSTLRREFHSHPKPRWREFWTTCRIIEEAERLGVIEWYVGEDVLDTEYQTGLPDEEALDQWFVRARELGATGSVLDQLEGEYPSPTSSRRFASVSETSSWASSTRTRRRPPAA